MLENSIEGGEYSAKLALERRDRVLGWCAVILFATAFIYFGGHYILWLAK